MIDKDCLRDALRLVAAPAEVELLIPRLEESCGRHLQQGRSEPEALVCALHDTRPTQSTRPSRPIGLLVWMVILGATLIYQYAFAAPRFKSVFAQVGVPVPALTLAVLRISDFVGYVWPVAVLLLGIPVWLVVSEWRLMPPRLGRYHLICGLLVLALLAAAAVTTHGLAMSLYELLHGLSSRKG